ncbi:ABC1 kinase family protein [Mycolicibacter nonchromogenicus]
MRRTMPLAGFTARAAGGRMVATLREKVGDTGAVEKFHERTAERYAELLGHSKGVLMKVGQMFSLFDAGAVGGGELSPYQKALTKLQADAPPMAPELAREVFRTELGRSVDEVFTEFTDEPMAAASIGQVHRAVLPDGRQVAVKVQYPGVAEAIRADLANTELLTTVIRFASAASGPAPDLRQNAREVAERITEEIDYRHEAANITTFATLYRDHPFIRVPELIPEVSSDRVLTMTYLDGLDWATARQADQDLKNTWAEVICRMVTGSYRHANLFHADPHPGNYRFGPDGTVGFVDFGCVKVLSEPVRRGLTGTLRAALDDDRAALLDWMPALGFSSTDSTLSGDEAYRWWTAIVHELLQPQPVTYSPETVSRTLRSLVDIVSADQPTRRVTLPPDLVLFSRLTLSMNAVFAALGSTFDVRSTIDDMDGAAEPTTALGKQHRAWVTGRGLPSGLDDHDAS